MVESSIGKTLGKRLELKRKEYGFTQTGLANALNVKQSEIAKWESGVVPKVETLDKLSRELNVSIDYLIGKTDEKNLNDGFIADQIGLNEKAISILRLINGATNNDWNGPAADNKKIIDCINLLLNKDYDLWKEQKAKNKDGEWTIPSLFIEIDNYIKDGNRINEQETTYLGKEKVPVGAREIYRVNQINRIKEYLDWISEKLEKGDH